MIALIKFLDKYFGKLAIMFLCLFKKRSVMFGKSDVCFIQLWGLGESLLTLPAIKKFKSVSSITVLCTERNRVVFEKHSFIDEVIVLPMNPFKILSFIFSNKNRWNLVIDFEEYLNISAIISFFIGKVCWGFSHGARSKLYSKTVDYDDRQYVARTFCDLVDEEFKELVFVNYEDYNKSCVESWIKKFNPDGKKMVGLFPFTAESAPWRAWNMERWIQLYQKLKKQGCFPFFVMGPSDLTFMGGPPIFMKDFHDLAYLLTKLDCFVSNDTGPMHLSACQGCRTVCLFTANIPIRWAPRDKQHKVIWHKVKCCPCIDSKTGKMNPCTNNMECSKLITVEEVLEAVLEK